MSEDLEIESIPEEDTGGHTYYVDRIELDELRRYVCLDMARMCLVAPEKVVVEARKMESFLLGKGVRGAVE